MCGIAGYFGRRDASPTGAAVLERMVGALRHRGPDGEGVWCDGVAGLGHTRLSIIDLAAGAQPMSNDDDSVWISFNGEIFNYIELRAELIARGRTFRTNSDTEVIIRLYEEMGPDCVNRLNGDFAFAIWDTRRRQTDARARPHGRAPALLYAARRRALLRLRGEGAAAGARASRRSSIRWRSTRSSRSGSRSRRARSSRTSSKLPPAHVLIARDGSVDVRPYWALSFPDAKDADRGDEDEDRRCRRGARAACRRHPHPPALRRAGRRVSFRRARFLVRDGARRPLRVRPAAHVLGSLRNAGIRRDRVPAGDG